MTEYEVGDIVQLNPETVGNLAFAACFMVISEVHSWGVQGYVQAIGAQRGITGGQAYYRAIWSEIEPTNGKAVWIME
jgi:hypothetical protein